MDWRGRKVVGAALAGMLLWLGACAPQLPIRAQVPMRAQAADPALVAARARAAWAQPAEGVWELRWHSGLLRSPLVVARWHDGTGGERLEILQADVSTLADETLVKGEREAWRYNRFGAEVQALPLEEARLPLVSTAFEALTAALGQTPAAAWERRFTAWGEEQEELQLTYADGARLTLRLARAKGFITYAAYEHSGGCFELRAREIGPLMASPAVFTPFDMPGAVIHPPPPAPPSPVEAEAAARELGLRLLRPPADAPFEAVASYRLGDAVGTLYHGVERFSLWQGEGLPAPQAPPNERPQVRGAPARLWREAGGTVLAWQEEGAERLLSGRFGPARALELAEMLE